ncbi:MAG: NADH:flavin oxidoreductase, partial [Planctomycetota bacterium]
MAEYTPPGHHKTFAAFREHLRTFGPDFDADEHVLGGPESPLAQPFEASGLQIGNRFAMHPMEGWDGTSDGLPTAHTLRRWRRFGQSGAKLIWGGEAFAVQADGRANPNQLYLNEDVDVVGGLRALLGQVQEGHAEAGFAS